MQEVGGSSPPVPTNYLDTRKLDVRSQKLEVTVRMPTHQALSHF